METWKSILLGLVQGVTEFLPVSSSGHLVLFKQLLSVEQVPLLFDVLLHVATLVVVIFFFRARIAAIIRSLISAARGRAREEDSYNIRLTGVILLGTVLTAIIGFSFQDLPIFRETRTVSLLFIITGVLLLSVRFTTASADQRPRVSHALWVGIAQGLGTLPGISRSGITISAALWAGIDRTRAGELSFLMSIPAVAGALILEMRDLSELSMQLSWGGVAAGFITAAAAGFLSLKVLMWLIQSGRLYLFSIYLIPLGLAGLFLL